MITPLAASLTPLGRGRGAGLVPPLPSLALWLKADSLALSDGASVTSWPCEAGYGPTFSGGVSPTYRTNRINGLPAVVVSGTQYLTATLSLGTAGSASPISIFAVGKSGAGAGYKRLITVEARFFFGARSNEFASFHGDGGTWIAPAASWGSGAALTTGTPYLLESICTTTADTGYRNAASVGTRSDTMTGFAGGTAYVGGYPAFSQLWDSDIAEILIYTTALTTTDRQQVEAYLNGKYALY